MYHFLPGTPILSLATVGCNLHCKNCQNWEISQDNPENVDGVRAAAGADPGAWRPNTAARRSRTRTASRWRTMNTRWTAACARAKPGCGTCSSPPATSTGRRSKIVPATSTARTSTSRPCPTQFYRGHLRGDAEAGAGRVRAGEVGWASGWRLTNLVIPTLNDSDEDFKRLCPMGHARTWAKIRRCISRGFSRSTRCGTCRRTPPDTLDRAKPIAAAEGLQHVYIGNLARPEGNNTYCAKCGGSYRAQGVCCDTQRHRRGQMSRVRNGDKGGMDMSRRAFLRGFMRSVFAVAAALWTARREWGRAACAGIYPGPVDHWTCQSAQWGKWAG